MVTVRGRVLLVLLALQAALVGCWAGLFPRRFYDGFPGFGRAWVSVDGPYNEHLVRDVGSLNLALLVLTCAALAWPGPRLNRLVGLVWLAYTVPHLTYHVLHVDVYDTTDRMLNVLTLAAGVVLPALLVLGPRWPARRRGRQPGLEVE